MKKILTKWKGFLKNRDTPNHSGPPVTQTVYVGGSYMDDKEKTKACYWVNGVRHEMDGVAVNAITIADGKVYAAGIIYRHGNDNEICGYWVDGKHYELPGCSAIRDIHVDSGDVYVTGIRKVGNKTENGYWINGVYRSPPNNSDVLAIAMINGVVYTAGYYTSECLLHYACYWVNGIRKELPNSEHFAACAIEVVNGSIYVVAVNSLRICYWVDGVQYMISNLVGETIGFKAFAVFNGNVYIASTKSYWINSRYHNIPAEPRTDTNSTRKYPQNYTIAGRKVYITGFEAARDFPRCIAYYWVEGRTYYLNGDYASSIFVAEN